MTVAPNASLGSRVIISFSNPEAAAMFFHSYLEGGPVASLLDNELEVSDDESFPLGVDAVEAFATINGAQGTTQESLLWTAEMDEHDDG